VWIRKLKDRFSDQLLRGFSWLALGEVCHRLIRLGTVVVLSRVLSSSEYGLIAIVFITIEFASVFSLQGGIGSKIVHASDRDLPVLLNTAYWLNWIICGTIFVLQCLAAFPIAQFYRNASLTLPICAVASVYLIIPTFMIQGALIQRENRMKILALAGVTNSIVSNTLTIGFALMGMGIWSIVVAYVLSHISWLTIYLRNQSWRPPRTFTLERWQEILFFAKDPLGIELLDKLRANLDYILIGRFLNVEQLGIYYFAFNAGLGITLNVLRMFSATLLPYFCSAREDLDLLKQKYFKGLKTISMVTFPLIVLQSCLAPFYVPIVFGQRWTVAIPILIVICLSAIPRPFALASEQLLLSLDKGAIGLRWNLIFTVIFAIALLIAVQFNIFTVALCVLFVHLLALPGFTAWVTHYVFSKPVFSERLRS
jgi:O-antigen/teichoic acid export membrane protein